MTNKIRFMVLLSVLAGMLAGSDCVHAQTWTGSGARTWTPSDSDDFTPTYNDGATATFLDAGAGTLTVQAGGVTPGSVDVNSSSDYTFTGGSIGGTGTMTKSGAGKLTPIGVNTYSGGTTLYAGTLAIGSGNSVVGEGNNALGSGALTIAGNASVAAGYGNNPTLANSVIVNSGVTATICKGFQYNNMTFTGPLSGAGTLKFFTAVSGAGGSLGFLSSFNTFTGTIDIEYDRNPGGGLTVNSLADSANPIRLQGTGVTVPAIFKLGAGTATPLLFNGRHIELNGTGAGGGYIQNNNATDGNTITINTDLLISATGNKTFTLGGSNPGNNTFAGAITNGSNAVISATKADGGKWILSGTNTYNGGTTVSGGKLILSNLWSVATGNLAVASGKVLLDYSGTRSVAGLVFGAANQSPGVYNSSNSPAYIEGAGNLITGDPAYKVTYCDTNAHGGTVPVDWNDYPNGQTVTVMGTGTLYRTKAAFRGWTTQPNGGGVRYSKDSLFVITNNTQLFSYWTEDGTVIIIK